MMLTNPGNPITLPYSGRKHKPPMPGASALDVRDLSVAYAGANRPPALIDFSLRVRSGRMVALVGHNGAGKSTLLKAVAGLLKPTGGDIRIFGNPVGACHHRVAYLPQRGDIDWTFPITLNGLVSAGRYVHLGWLRRMNGSDHAIVNDVIARLGLGSLTKRQIGELSGGQQQRALLARALAQQSDLLLLDEPLNAVDAETRAIIMGVLHDLTAQGKTILVSTHDLGMLETDFDEAFYLADGRLEDHRVFHAQEALFAGFDGVQVGVPIDDVSARVSATL